MQLRMGWRNTAKDFAITLYKAGFPLSQMLPWKQEKTILTYFSYQAIRTFKLTMMWSNTSNVFSMSHCQKLGCFISEIALWKKDLSLYVFPPAISTVISFATSCNHSAWFEHAHWSRLSKIFLNRTTDFCSVKASSHKWILLQHLWFLWFFSARPTTSCNFNAWAWGLEALHETL